MGLRSFFINLANRSAESTKTQATPGNTQIEPVQMVGPTPVKTIEVGSTGTQIFAGYIDEEYIANLRGKEWADTVDQMRRSDANVKMITAALKSPLKSSQWFIQTKEKSEMAEMQKRLIEKALFEDIEKSFTRLVGEMLTFIDYGYSLFEITYQPKLDDKEIGSYNTLKSISYRSQRTIERWNVQPDGHLVSVTQISYGDLGKLVDMDARFLLHFAPDMEGSDYEGISTLRPCYGNWFRKNMFLKLMAAGIEKYAIPTPVLNVPEGSEAKPEYAAAIKALKCYTSNQANYLILPAGWELKFNNVVFDSEKIRDTINFENQEMVNSILASFLLLGQGGAGSLALSKDLSDFFAQTVTYLADHISEQIGRKVIKPLIAMNFGDAPCVVELRCDSLEDKADQAWATMIGTLVDKNLVKPDSELEKYVREKYKLPEAVIPLVVPGLTPPNPLDPNAAPVADDEANPKEEESKKQFSEKKKSQKENLKEPKLIRDTAARVRELGLGFLPGFAKNYSNSVIRVAKNSSDSNKIKAPIYATVPSIEIYKNAVKAFYGYAVIVAGDIQENNFRKTKRKLSEFRMADSKLKRVESALESLEEAVTELGKAETSDQYKKALASLDKAQSKANDVLSDYYTPAQKKIISAKSEVFTETQKNDVIKSIDLQYQSSLDYADYDQLEYDLFESSDKAISGPMTTTGPDVQASSVVNDALQDAAEAWSKETGDEIVSWTFIAVDDDVTTELCSELNDCTFADSDPDMKKYTPPLHFNCRSFMQVNTSSMKDLPEITGAPKLSKKAQTQIQFGEMKKEKKPKPVKS